MDQIPRFPDQDRPAAAVGKAVPVALPGIEIGGEDEILSEPRVVHRERIADAAGADVRAQHRFSVPEIGPVKPVAAHGKPDAFAVVVSAAGEMDE